MNSNQNMETKLKPKDYKALFLPLISFTCCFLLCFFYVLNTDLPKNIKMIAYAQIFASSLIVATFVWVSYRHLFGYKIFSLKIPRKKH